MSCKLKKCPEYKTCLVKKNPFQNGIPCKGYKDYINQDALRRKGDSLEMSFTSANIRENILQEQLVFTGFSDRAKLIVQLFFFDRRSPSEIADDLYCSEQYVYQVVRQCKDCLHSFLYREKRQKKRKTDI
jgi:DNA-directed RNA polymerase specialized sigma subunit